MACIAGIVLVSVLYGVSPETAAEMTGAVDETAPAIETPREEGFKLSLDFAVRYESDYYFRGIVQRSDAFNVQPSAAATLEVIEHEGWTLSLTGGSWSNFSDDLAPGHNGDFDEHWYEHDAYAGLVLSVGRVTASAVYTWYFSPASDFKETEDITVTLAYDDAGLWDEGGIFAMNPSVSIAFETRNAASGPDSGVWLGLGLAPSVGLGEWSIGELTLSFPMSVGLSVDDYYQLSDGSSETFGYAEAGVKLTIDLAEELGKAAPTVDVGVRYLMLGGVLDDLNGGDEDEVVFSVGFGWSF